jgi:ribosomal protein S18 acetylase RimI-like enzyme
VTELRVRKPSADEADVVAALVNAHAIAVRGEPNITPETVREWLSDPAIDIRVAERAGELACYGDMMFAPDGARAHLDLREHPEHEGSAVVLLDAFEAAAAERGATICRAYSDRAETSYVDLLEARGYRTIRCSFEMLIALDHVPTRTPLPPDVEFRSRQEGEERAMYEASMDAFADHWGFEPRPYDEWARRHVESALTDRSLQFLAFEGDEIAGVCLCAPHQSLQPGFGWVDVLGVRPPWRRQGLALALLTRAFAEFRYRGFDRVGLGVDGESTTGALELYERAGMYVAKQEDTFERTLA